MRMPRDVFTGKGSCSKQSSLSLVGEIFLLGCCNRHLHNLGGHGTTIADRGSIILQAFNGEPLYLRSKLVGS